jgi:2-hydroxychromene-2-carboxylate isomerase
LLAKPFLLGGALNANNPNYVPAALPMTKLHYKALDLYRNANMKGVSLKVPPFHPARSLLAMRCILALGEPYLPVARKFYSAYFQKGLNIAEDEVILKVLQVLILWVHYFIYIRRISVFHPTRMENSLNKFVCFFLVLFQC